MKTSEGYRKTCVRYNVPYDIHMLTFSCYKNQKLMASKRTCQYLAEAIKKASEKHDFDVWAYVFMPDHVHIIIAPKNEIYSISAILQSIKQPVARRALNHLRKNNLRSLKLFETGQKHTKHRFWQDGGGHDKNVVQKESLGHLIDYIHSNPVQRELVEDEQDWVWSSSWFWHEDVEGPVPVDLSLFTL